MRSSKILVLFASLSAAVWFVPCKTSAQEGSVSYQRFYDDLSPYGAWVEYPNYGYVWIPNAISGFSPYATGGHWVLTDEGWTWDSDYPWGWAAFHYGRWDYDNAYGWFWIPIMCGVQHGYRGADLPDITDGLLYGPASASVSPSGMIITNRMSDGYLYGTGIL